MLRSAIITSLALSAVLIGSHASAAETSIMYRAPGLSADLTSYSLNGLYITPQMAFSGIYTVSTPTYTTPTTSVIAVVPPVVYSSALAGQTFVPRNSNSAIVFTNLSAAGTVTIPPQAITFNYTYRNPGFVGPFILQQALFAPDQTMIGVSEETRSIATGATSAFGKSQNFPGTLANGTYLLRVRAYSIDRTTVYDENSFNLLIKR